MAKRSRAHTALREFGVPAVAAFAFLIIESAGTLPEYALTAFIILVTLLMFAVRDHKNEPLLFGAGVIFGLLIEVGLRYFGYQQVWTDGSLLGVPYWLPIAWGVGFVLITRFGIVVRGKKIA